MNNTLRLEVDWSAPPGIVCQRHAYAFQDDLWREFASHGFAVSPIVFRSRNDYTLLNVSVKDGFVEVHLLGTFAVEHNQTSISISSRPAQSLFAYLILNVGTSHRREKLAGMLWPDSLEATARDNLRHALW